MSLEAKYTLEKYHGPGSRYTCPSCGKHRVFVRYFNCATNEYLADHVGRCNREIECGYHFKPKQYFDESGSSSKPAATGHVIKVSTRKEPDYIPDKYFQKSLIPDNNLAKYLSTILGSANAAAYLKRFRVGTAKHWPGATVFWQIDSHGSIRSGKIILYNAITGRRIKDPFPHITWVHQQLIQRKIINQFNLRQCLFGEHQIINEPNKNIGLVESEKTAIIASAYLPELLWMATGSLNGLKKEMLQPIIGRKIILYPDLKAYDKWDKKASELRREGFNIITSDFLEKANFPTEAEIGSGFDLGDYLPRTI